MIPIQLLLFSELADEADAKIPPFSGKRKNFSEAPHMSDPELLAKLLLRPHLLRIWAQQATPEQLQEMNQVLGRTFAVVEHERRRRNRKEQKV